MPNATVSTTTRRVELKTCPEGYVVLRQLPYGDWLYRSDIAMNMAMKGEAGAKKEELEMAMKTANAEVTKFEFSKCIVDHNLEDANEQKLDFGANGLQQLDPRIGQEISEAISEMHEFDPGNSSSASAAA